MKPCHFKYDGLDMCEESRTLLMEDLEQFASHCNGVGSRVGWFGKLTYHFIPNTIWGLNITPASDIHDVEYSYPKIFVDRECATIFKVETDIRFMDNLKTLINRETEWGWVRRLRLSRAKKYYRAVKNIGKDSFFDGKMILN